MVAILLLIFIGLMYLLVIGIPIMFGYYGAKFIITYFSNKNKLLENKLKEQEARRSKNIQTPSLKR